VLQQRDVCPSRKSEYVRVALDGGDREDTFICPVVDALRLFFERGPSVRVVGLAEAPGPLMRRLLDEAERG
jgi:hypothetical protein